MFSLLAINTDSLSKALNLFLFGMVAVILVLAVICFITYLMNFISNKLIDAKIAHEQQENSNDNNTNGGNQ